MRQAGSVIKKGRRFYAVYRSPESKKQLWDGSFGTREEARMRLTEVLGDMDKGSYFEPTSLTFSSSRTSGWRERSRSKPRPRRTTRAI